MAIMTAIEKDDRVFVYDTDEKEKFSERGNLHGYTHEFVSIIQDEKVAVYDSDGNFVQNF